MTNPEATRAVELLRRLGLSTEAIGPVAEWSPSPTAIYQSRHASFWSIVEGILPDDQDDESYWMTEEASFQLRQN